MSREQRKTMTQNQRIQRTIERRAKKKPAPVRPLEFVRGLPDAIFQAENFVNFCFELYMKGRPLRTAPNIPGFVRVCFTEKARRARKER